MIILSYHNGKDSPKMNSFMLSAAWNMKK